VTGTAGTGQIAVADDGPGMTAEQAARVFERFYRTDDARARAHGGEITVDTRLGQGAVFYARLPLAAGPDGGT
jgi:two-component system OmpR family sensor kinase